MIIVACVRVAQAAAIGKDDPAALGRVSCVWTIDRLASIRTGLLLPLLAI
jgi:hypothetical protein